MSHASLPAKRVLVVQYSQSGQLNAVTRQLIAPLLADPRFAVHVETLQPLTPFPFPWPFFRFLDAFPESAHLKPRPLQALTLTGDEDFDLVILPYQVWFLAPSQPITAFLQHPVAQRLLRDKPVVTALACRNMWMTAHDKMRVLIAATGARLIDHIALVDPSPTLASFITTPRWMFTGRKNSFWGMPEAGLNALQITGTRRFGLALRDGLLNDQEKTGQPLLAGLGAATANARLFISERAGTRSFYAWGKLLMAAGKPGSPQRLPLLVLYLIFLVVMIVTIVPTSLALQAMLRRWMQSRLSRIRAHYEQPSGSSTQRSHIYED